MKPHTTKLRVRYAETDQMGVVHHSNYFVYFEMARIEYLRSLGLPYDWLEKEDIYLMVLEAYCKYKAPAHFDDILVVETSLSKLTSAQLGLSYRVFRDKDRQLVAEGSSVLVCVDENRKPRRIPDKLRNALSVEGVSLST